MASISWALNDSYRGDCQKRYKRTSKVELSSSVEDIFFLKLEKIRKASSSVIKKV